MKSRAATAFLFLVTAISAARAATETQLSPLTPPATAPYRFRLHAASSGRGYLLAWEEATVADPETSTIRIRAIDAAGVPIGDNATAVGTGMEPRITWNGSEYLVVWGITATTSGSEFTPSVAGVRVREDGSLIDAQPVALVSEVNPFSYFTTADWSGSQYLVTWNRGMALVDADLRHFKLVLFPSPGGLPFYTATSGGSFVVLLSSYSGYYHGSLTLLPISAAGVLGTAIPLAGARGNIVGVDGGYAMILDDDANLKFLRLRADGTAISTSVVAQGGNGFPRIATRDGRIVSSWLTDNGHVCTARLDVLSQPVCSAGAAGIQHDPVIATSSTSVLLAWSERTNGRDTVRVIATPLSEMPRAEPGTGRNAAVASAPAVERRSDGSIVAAWSQYNILTDRMEVHLGGLTNKGAAASERAVFPTAFDQTSPAIATGAGRTMVLWTEGPPEPAKIRMTIVDDASKAVIATVPLAPGAAPSVAFDGKEWLAAWQSSGVIRYALINSDGNTIASGAMQAETPSSSFQTAPAVAWNGTSFFVTWHEVIAAGAGLFPGERIQVAAVSAAGAASGPITLDSADTGLASPSIAAGGGRLLVSWGTAAGTLRQALFDAAGKQLGNVIDFAGPSSVSRTQTHATSAGFATLVGNRIALTSSDGRVLGSLDVPPVAIDGDFAVDATNRFVLVYSRDVESAVTAFFAQTVGLPRRHSSDH